MENKKEFNNEILKRLEISFQIVADKNPNFIEMKKLISEKFKKTEDCIDVYNILGNFGSKKFLIKAYIYESPEKLVEVKNLTKTKKQKDLEKKTEEDKKKALEEGKKNEGDGAEDTSAEEKKEEKVEEKKDEENVVDKKPVEDKKDEKEVE